MINASLATYMKAYVPVECVHIDTNKYVCWNNSDCWSHLWTPRSENFFNSSLWRKPQPPAVCVSMVTHRHPRLLNSQAHVLPCLHSLLSLPAGFMTYHVLYSTAFTQFYLPTKCCLFLFLFPSKSRLPCSSSPASSHSSGVNESRQVLQEQPDFAQSLLREPNTPVIRKSRGTSTQVSP